jgi:hypothetical protein
MRIALASHIWGTVACGTGLCRQNYPGRTLDERAGTDDYVTDHPPQARNEMSSWNTDEDFSAGNIALHIAANRRDHLLHLDHVQVV